MIGIQVKLVNKEECTNSVKIRKIVYQVWTWLCSSPQM